MTLKEELNIIRIHGNERKADIINLLNESFPEKWGDEKYFNWKFTDRNPRPLTSNYWICENQDMLAGCYGYVPVSINIKGKSYPAGEPVDGATHKDYKRSGIFQKLMEKSFEDVTNEGLLFSYAIGTPTSKKTFFKCGWRDWVNLEKYTVKFSACSLPKNLLLKIYKCFFSVFLSVTELLERSNLEFKLSNEKPDEKKLDVLYSEYSKKFDVIFCRDIDYLKWRLSNPKSNYFFLQLTEKENLCGIFIINHIADEQIYVVEDYAYLNIVHLKKMLRLMLKSAIKSNIRKIKIEFNTKSKINIGFLKYFFSKKLIVNYLIKNGNLDSSLFDLVLNTDKIHVTRLDKNE